MVWGITVDFLFGQCWIISFVVNIGGGVRGRDWIG